MSKQQWNSHKKTSSCVNSEDNRTINRCEKYFYLSMLAFDALLILCARTWYRSFLSWTACTPYGEKSYMKYPRDGKRVEYNIGHCCWPGQHGNLLRRAFLVISHTVFLMIFPEPMGGRQMWSWKEVVLMVVVKFVIVMIMIKLVILLLPSLEE